MPISRDRELDVAHAEQLTEQTESPRAFQQVFKIAFEKVQAKSPRVCASAFKAPIGQCPYNESVDDFQSGVSGLIFSTMSPQTALKASGGPVQATLAAVDIDAVEVEDGAEDMEEEAREDPVVGLQSAVDTTCAAWGEMCTAFNDGSSSKRARWDQDKVDRSLAADVARKAAASGSAPQGAAACAAGSKEPSAMEETEEDAAAAEAAQVEALEVVEAIPSLTELLSLRQKAEKFAVIAQLEYKHAQQIAALERGEDPDTLDTSYGHLLMDKMMGPPNSVRSLHIRDAAWAALTTSRLKPLVELRRELELHSKWKRQRPKPGHPCVTTSGFICTADKIKACVEWEAEKEAATEVAAAKKVETLAKKLDTAQELTAQARPPMVVPTLSGVGTCGHETAEPCTTSSAEPSVSNPCCECMR